MAVKAVTAVKASYAVTIRGVAYAKDQTLTGAQVRSIPHLDAYLSKGVLYTTPDRYARRPGSRQPRPTALDPTNVRAL